MSIVDVIVGSIIIAVLILSSTSLFVGVKNYLVDAQNYYEANKFSMETLDNLQAWDYANLPAGSLVPCPMPLDTCDFGNKFNGGRSYLVTDRDWDTNHTYHYKEITVTTTWQYKGQPKSVSLGVLRRNGNT